MVTVNVRVKTNLSRLLAQVEAGEDIVIVRNGKPVARLVEYRPRGKRQFGAWKDRISRRQFLRSTPREGVSSMPWGKS